jgi:hypothetical protein
LRKVNHLEPHFRQFSFCATLKCLSKANGIPNVTLPPFKNHLGGTEKLLQEFQKKDKFSLQLQEEEELYSLQGNSSALVAPQEIVL